MKELRILNSITTRDEDSITQYLADISRYALLTAEEEVELARRFRCGEREAGHRLVCANLRFVVSVAKQYQHQGQSLSDLINEGNLGLIKAAERFDDTFGFKFISYAVWWIRQAIITAISDKGTLVRLPQSASAEEVATLMGLSRERVRQLREGAIRSLAASPQIGLLRKYIGA